MPQYHVYQVSKDGEYKAVDTTGCNSIREVESKLPANVASYGLAAESPEEAIATVKSLYESKGGLYKTPESMQKLRSLADDLSSKRKEFI